jgi:2-methylisocitrate lyase-like PEP mutase family enzyme
MSREEQGKKAEAFRALHRAPSILLLPNAWDVVSARIYELEGFNAVGTTSAGIAASLGYPDGERIPVGEMVEAVHRIARRIRIPVSADMEAGYAQTTEGVARAAREFIRAGAVGLNLEDGTGNPEDPLHDPALVAERVSVIREMATAEGIPVFLNARTDVYLISGEEMAGRFQQAIDRARIYIDAGADCIFIPDMPGTLDRETLVRLVSEIKAPINIIAGEKTPSVSELEKIGIARLSFGPRPMRATLALLRNIAREIRDQGTYELMTADALSYSEVNRMFEVDSDS